MSHGRVQEGRSLILLDYGAAARRGDHFEVTDRLGVDGRGRERMLVSEE